MLSHSVVSVWTVAHQAPLSMELSRQEYWSGLPFPHPRALPDPGIKPVCLASPALVVGFFTIEPPGKPSILFFFNFKINVIEVYFCVQFEDS